MLLSASQTITQSSSCSPSQQLTLSSSLTPSQVASPSQSQSSSETQSGSQTTSHTQSSTETASGTQSGFETPSVSCTGSAGTTGSGSGTASGSRTADCTHTASGTLSQHMSSTATSSCTAGLLPSVSPTMSSSLSVSIVVSASSSSSSGSTAPLIPSLSGSQSPLLLYYNSSSPRPRENVSLRSDPYGGTISPQTSGIIGGACALVALLIVVVAIMCIRSRWTGGDGGDVVDLSNGDVNRCTASVSQSEVAYDAAPADRRDASAVPVPCASALSHQPAPTVYRETAAHADGMTASVHLDIEFFRTPLHETPSALRDPRGAEVDANSDSRFGPGSVTHPSVANGARSSVRVVLVRSVPAGLSAAQESLGGGGLSSLRQSAVAGSAHQDALDGEVQRQRADAAAFRHSGSVLGTHPRTPTPGGSAVVGRTRQPERRSSFDAAASRSESDARHLPLARRRASAANLAAASLWMAGTGSSAHDAGDPMPPQGANGRIPGQV